MLPIAEYDLLVYLGHCVKQDYPISMTQTIYSWFGYLHNALTYAHRLDIKHQDTKPFNISIKDQQPYLADFGLAKGFEAKDCTLSASIKPRDTRAYSAPELQTSTRRGRKTDVFSLGCVFSEMVTVTQSRSVDDFWNKRQKTDSTAFHNCLPMVVKRLDNLDIKKKENKVREAVRNQTKGMVYENPNERGNL